MSKPRILVLRGGAIGDFISTFPALRALRKRWPGCYIELVGYPHIAQLAQAGGLVDTIVSLDKAETARYFLPKPSISEGHADYIRSFDLIVTYLYDPDGYVKNCLLSSGAKQVVYGCPIVRQSHAVDTLMKPLEELAIYQEGIETPRLELKVEHIKKGCGIVRKFGKKIIAVHPGSGSPAKNWPLAHFIKLCSLVSGQDRFKPVFLLGEADTAIQAELTALKNPIPVISGHSLVDIAGILSQSSGYAGNDSGITHLAAALQIPVAAIYGTANRATWAPRGSNAKILSATSLQEIDPLHVFNELQHLISGLNS